MKKFFVLVLTILLLGMVVTDVGAWSARQKANKLSTAGSDSIYQDFNDQKVMSINYNGSEASWSLVLTSYTIRFQAPDGTEDTNVSADGYMYTGTGGSAAENTMVEIVDILNATDDWSATLLDAPKALDAKYIRGTTDVVGTGLDAGAQVVGTAYELTFSSGTTGCPADKAHENYLAITPASGKRITLMKVIVQADVASTAVVKIIYEDDSASDAEVVAWNEAVVNDTDKTIIFSIAGGTMGREFDVDDRVIIMVDSDEPQDGVADMQVHHVEW